MPKSSSPSIISWTHHARQRCAELGVSRSLVERVIARPDTRHPDRWHLDRVHYRGPQVIAVVAEPSGTVITVLLNTPEPYIHGRDQLGPRPEPTGEAA